MVVATSPQKVRPEDGGERQRTLNCPTRIPAELRSRNKNFEPHFLLQKTNRIQRPRGGGRDQTRPSKKRRNSRSHWNIRENRLQSVHKNRVGFIPNL